MNRLVAYLRKYRDSKRHVRPWALAVPILVLLICLPILRPIRYPDPRDTSDDELARLATVQAMVEKRTLAIDASGFRPRSGVVTIDDHAYSAQPPVFSALLASAYWSMHRYGVTFASNPEMVSYLLTVLGTTLPAAGVAGLAYRMARLFELPRIWRAVLATSCVMGSGLLAYATVLNEHIPAAALVMAAAGSLVHIAINRKRLNAGVWLATAGFCAALALTIDVTSGVFIPLLAGVIFTLPWKFMTRVGGLIVYVLAMAPPIVLHCALTIPITGDWKPVFLHRELVVSTSTLSPVPIYTSSDDWDDDDLTDNGFWSGFGHNLTRVGATLFGDHGLLSHFPVLVVGVLGVTMVMHRHWPSSTKMLAASSAGAALVVVLIYALSRPQWRDAAFAVRWFVVFVPMLMFWAGAWLRDTHRPLSWAIAGILLTFSTVVTLIGATGPIVPEGFSGYTAADALDRLVSKNRPVPEGHLASRR